jgi:hypothetical protein
MSGFDRVRSTHRLLSQEAMMNRNCSWHPLLRWKNVPLRFIAT